MGMASKHYQKHTVSVSKHSDNFILANHLKKSVAIERRADRRKKPTKFTPNHNIKSTTFTKKKPKKQKSNPTPKPEYRDAETRIRQKRESNTTTEYYVRHQLSTGIIF